MSETKIIKIWKASAIILAALNICILSLLLFKPSIRMERHQLPPHGGGPAEFIIHELQLNEAQRSLYDGMKDQHHKTIDSLQRLGGNLRHTFFENLKGSQPDSVNVNKMANEIADNQKQIELVTFRHFQQLRKMLSPPQQEKFDNIINEVLHRMAPQQGPPPPLPGQ